MEIQAYYRENVLGREMVVYGDKESPLFLAKDVAEWIGYDVTSLNKMINFVDDDEKLFGKTFRLGQNRSMWFLTEHGVYEVLFQSTKPVAKQFKKEVKRILQEMRVNGVSATNSFIEQALSDPDFAIRTLQQLKEEREGRIRAETNLENATPKINFANAILSTQDSISIGELAKLLFKNGHNIGQRRLFIWMRSNGYVMYNKERRNIPTQWSLERGYLEYCEGTYYVDGVAHLSASTRVLVKGQQHILNEFSNSII